MAGRIKTMVLLLLLFFVLLFGRLYYIQMSCGEELAAGARRQQLIPVIHENHRGTIYDRNMVRLTNTSWSYYYLIHKDQHTDQCQGMLALADARKVGRKGEDYFVYKVNRFDSAVNYLLQEKWQAYGFCVGERYEKQQTAVHLIGCLDEAGEKGVKGLEKTYDAQLATSGPEFYFIGNGLGQMVPGAGMVKGDSRFPEDPLSVVTTIDLVLQEKIEDVFQHEGLVGAAIVADVHTGQVLAMVSSPSFDPSGETTMEQLTLDSRKNRVTEGQYAIGAMYDGIVSAAILEGKGIIETAQSMGLGEAVFSPDFDEEKGVMHTSEGGENFLATPAQICQMTNMIANEGKMKPLSLTLHRVENINEGMEVIGKDTVLLLQTQMKQMSTGGWCTGFIPEEKPKYTITVYIETEKTGSKMSLPIFQKINDFLAQSDTL